MSSNNQDAKDLLRDAVAKGAQAAADSDATKTTSADVSLITNKVLKEVAPVLISATNNEPWYQSRVMWGSILAIAAPILAPAISWIAGTTVTITADQQADLAGWLATVGSGVGGLIAIYGRFIAKKPLGE